MRLPVFSVGLLFVSLGIVPIVSAQNTSQTAPSSQKSGTEIQFDTKGVEFGSWIRGFISQVKRNWKLPIIAATENGHVVVAFDVRKDGTITAVTIETPSVVAAFNDNARAAIVDSNPTQPLPQEYPVAQAHFTVTFHYSELPSSSPPSSAAGGTASSASTQASSIDPQFRADIRRLMDASGAAALSVQLANLLAGTFLDAIKRIQPNVPDRAIAIVKEVVSTEAAREMTAPDGIQEQVVELYAKYFTRDDVAALLAFYGTPAGQKMLTATPLMMRESIAIGQKWAETNSQRIVAVLQERLRAEGLIREH